MPFVIVSFPRFAGGKFIINCLALSRHCCAPDLATAKHLLVHPNDCQFRLERILATIPPSLSEMKKWTTTYEFSDVQLYGKAFEHWEAGIDASANSLVYQLIQNNIKMFLTSHGGDHAVRNLYKVWPKSPIIKLTNHRRFSTISQRLKSDCTRSLDFYAGNYCESKYNQLSGPDWPSWKCFESMGYNPYRLLGPGKHIRDEMLEFYNWSDIDGSEYVIDVDDCYFDLSKFLETIQNLYQWLELDDFCPDLITTYWRSYMKMHEV